MPSLSEREKHILDILVKTYVSTGEPVGSRTVAKSGLDLCAATVRNSMSDLEDKGYLSHPHTSAGRIPTDKGYRHYVDELMAQQELTKEVRQLIRKSVEMRQRDGNIESLLEQVSRVIADVTHNLGVALAPGFECGVFQRIEMLRLSESKMLIVLTIESGLVKTMVIEVDSAIQASELDETNRAINERLSGLSIGEIRKSVQERLRAISRGSPKLLRLIWERAETLFNFRGGEDLHLGGTGNFFLQREFSEDQEGLAALFEFLEKREPIVTILDERMNSEGITITIGNEHTSPELRGCSLLTSRYRVGNVSGLIGVIGPTRIQYANLIPLVEYVAGITEEMLAN